MEMDGGWLYWNLSDMKDFKYGYAALPTAKSNKNINFDDFWIMGRWAKNKDAAWQVMRVLTSVDATTAYSQMSFTPPTPRESLSAWLNGVSKATGQSVADLTRVTTGSIEKKRSQESPDHLFIQHPKLDQTYSQELDALTNNQEKAVDLGAPRGEDHGRDGEGDLRPVQGLPAQGLSPPPGAGRRLAGPPGRGGAACPGPSEAWPAPPAGSPAAPRSRPRRRPADGCS